MKVLFKGPFSQDRTGYAVFGRHLLLALDSIGVDVYPLPFMYRNLPIDYSTGVPRLDYLFKKTTNTPGVNPDIALALTVPINTSGYELHGKKRIMETLFESSKLPPTWAENLNTFDQVWNPSIWGKQMFIDSGIKEELVRVVPGGVDSKTFNSHAKPFDSYKKRDSFKFLCMGKWENRKGQKDLLRVFREEFGGSKEVELIIQAENFFIPNFSINKEIFRLGYAKEDLRNVRFLRSRFSVQDLVKLYNSVDCFVLPTRGEGWGLPIIEAMSCGLPTIATNCTSQKDFMTHENSYPLKHKGLVDAIEPRWQEFFLDSKWHEPDMDHLKELMRYVFEHREKAKKVGMRASQDMKNWSWENAAKIALKCFEELS